MGEGWEQVLGSGPGMGWGANCKIPCNFEKVTVIAKLEPAIVGLGALA